MEGTAPNWWVVGVIANVIIVVIGGVATWSLRFNISMAVKKMEGVDNSLSSLHQALATVNATLMMQTAELRAHIESDSLRFQHAQDFCKERNDSVTAQLASSKEANKYRHDELMVKGEQQHESLMEALRRINPPGGRSREK